jgi:hypothetical protein
LEHAEGAELRLEPVFAMGTGKINNAVPARNQAPGLTHGALPGNLPPIALSGGRQLLSMRHETGLGFPGRFRSVS